MSSKKKLLIIDGYGFIFRAYHVQPKLTDPSGAPVGAIYGFTSMLLKVLNDFKDITHGVVVFDTGGKNFRHEIYPDYKAHRPPAPEDLIPQFSKVRLAAQKLNFPILEKEGFEADDVIATLSAKIVEQGGEAIIISSDKDLMQLIASNVKMYDPINSKYIDHEDVLRKFGVLPNKVRDILALTGDRSDNIPGIPGIGPKTALDLITKLDSFHSIFDNIKKIENPRVQKLVSEHTKQAFLSYELTGLNNQINISLDLSEFIINPLDLNIVSSFLLEYGFRSLVKRVENLHNIQLQQQVTIFTEGDDERELVNSLSQDSHISSKPGQVTEEFNLIPITTHAQFDILYNKALESGIIGVQLVEHMALAHFIIVLEGECYVINIDTTKQEDANLFSYKAKEEIQLMPKVSMLISEPSIKKITCNLKGLLRFLSSQSYLIESAGASIEDLELMIYCISAGSKQEKMLDYDSSLAWNEQLTTLANIVKNFETKYNILKAKILEDEALRLYYDIDLPLCYLLHKIERTGVQIDKNKLKFLSDEFGGLIKTIEQEIYELAGSEFNIGSPKQLGEILFNKMGLPFAQNSAKSNNFSTSVDILEKLSKEGYKIADLLLKWRALSKLKTTYTDALPNYIDPATNRIHTTFLQNSTTTSRLSSQDPNLQNIPIRSLEGNKIREVFIAREGYQLISADYSQIELRILAHIASIQNMKDAFIKNIDIHSATAMQIFGVANEELTAEHRRKAKAINFGIIYGISAFGLAKQLDISTREASDYINKYFANFPGIKEYMEQTKSYAREHGYVKNLLGRKCYVPQINDTNHLLRQIAERAAINAPIQGMNAEIIKIAMLNIEKKIIELNLQTRIILQIHDELLFETPEDEVSIVTPLIKNIMEHAYNLNPPLVVEIKYGQNWMQAH